MTLVRVMLARFLRCSGSGVSILNACRHEVPLALSLRETLYPPGQPKKALGHQPQIDLCVANQATDTALLASETDRRRRYSIRMQPRWKHARSAAIPNVSSHAQGLEDKEISSPSSRGRKMSLTSPLIDQAFTLKTSARGVNE